MSNISNTFSAVVLEKNRPVRVLKSLTISGDIVEIGELRFKDSGSGDWLGFYDWLLNSDIEIIGIRQWLDPGLGQCLLDINVEGVEIDRENNILMIFFSESRNFDDHLSTSQSFGDNYLFMGNDGSVLLTFLTPQEWGRSNYRLVPGTQYWSSGDTILN